MSMMVMVAEENVAAVQRVRVNQHQMHMNDGDAANMLLTV